MRDDKLTSSKNNRWQRMDCSLCQSKQWHYEGSCTNHSDYNPKRKRVVVKDSVSPVFKEDPLPVKVVTPIVGRKKRRSSIPTIRIEREEHTRCAGCDEIVTPGLCHSGSIITGVANRIVEGSSLEDGQWIPTRKRITFFTRKHGLICSTCASDYHQVERWDGSFEPKVRIDSRLTINTFQRSNSREKIGPDGRNY